MFAKIETKTGAKVPPFSELTKPFGSQKRHFKYF